MGEYLKNSLGKQYFYSKVFVNIKWRIVNVIEGGAHEKRKSNYFGYI